MSVVYTRRGLSPRRSQRRGGSLGERRGPGHGDRHRRLDMGRVGARSLSVDEPLVQLPDRDLGRSLALADTSRAAGAGTRPTGGAFSLRSPDYLFLGGGFGGAFGGNFGVTFGFRPNPAERARFCTSPTSPSFILLRPPSFIKSSSFMR